MHLAVTIDTEEDNWGDYRSAGHTVENIRRIPELQRLFEDFDVLPTYLVAYSVAADETARSILRPIASAGRCEIGAHCHPWNTPPFTAGDVTRHDSMLCNLPSELQGAKIRRLHQTIEQAFGSPPISFRCGRWGFRADMARHLVETGYRIDSSVTPYVDWTSDHGPDFSTIPPWPFRFGLRNAVATGLKRPLLEVPVTIGFLRSCFTLSNTVLRAVQRPSLKRLRLVGALDRLRLVSKVWLSPELSTAEQMIALTKRMLRQNCRILNLTFHSPTLQAGLTPFVRNRSDRDRFLDHLRAYLSFTRDAGIRSIKLADALEIV
jgi:hypothetical protein